MVRQVFATLLLGALVMTASAADNAELARGAAVLAPFKRDLQGALQAGMKQGVIEAIGDCRLQAPAIAANASTQGVRVGRASHRLRNPENTTPEWAQPVLAAYLASAADRAPRSVALADNRVGYAEPIVLQPVCRACHGSNLEPDVAREIGELYPDDRAVGFSVGELRGIFWAEFPEVPE